MSLQDLANKYKPVSTTQNLTGLAALSSKYTKSTPKKKIDTSTVEGLATIGEGAGLGSQVADIVDPKPKLSFLQRLGTGLSALNPAEAILTGKEKGVGAGAVKYVKGIGQAVGSAVTGTDYDQTNRRYFKDVAKDLGVENKIAQFGIGFVGDVLLDPSTYFGGAIARGLTAGTKAGANLGLKTIGRAAPEVETGLRMAGTGLKDAFGKAFQYGYKASKGATDDLLTFMSKEQRAKIGLASSNLDRLGTGILTQVQREELALKMVAGKRAEFAAREAGASSDEIAKLTQQAAESADPVVKKAIEDQIARTQKIGEGVVENPYEVYFPFIKKDKVEKFLNETKGIKVGSEGYKKQFKNILTNDAIELDPAKAFFTRESQVVSDKMTRDFLTGFVKKYGKGLDEFASVDDAAKAGYQLIKEKGVLFGKELGYVPEFDAKLIRDSISPEFQTINMLAKATGFDAVTSLFKRSVTGLFAPFHIRNYVSGNIQNFEALGVGVFNPKNIAAGQKIAYIMAKGEKIPAGTMNIAGKEMKFKEVMKPFLERFSGDTFYNADFDLALKNGGALKGATGVFSKARIKETVKTAGLGQEAIPFKVGRAIGQFIEHQQKATAYVTALEQGKSIAEALKLSERAGFDYRALTRFESQIMRRIVPFYSFTRKNIELQLKTLGETPERINQVLRFFGNVGDPLSEDEKKFLPAFIRESIGVKLQDTPEGLKQYISSFGTPIEAFTQLFGSNPVLRAISQMNPLLKAPIEIGIGKDSFRQRDLKDVYTANEYKLAPQVIKDLLEIKEVKKPVYKEKNGKPVVVGEKIAYVADPVKLLIARSLFTSRGVSYLDQVFGGDMKGLVKALKVTTGIKPQQVDIESQKYFSEKDKQRALEDLLTRYGVVKQFTKTYVPKEK